MDKLLVVTKAKSFWVTVQEVFPNKLGGYVAYCKVDSSPEEMLRIDLSTLDGIVNLTPDTAENI